MDTQIFRCNSCGTERVYGLGQPYDETAQPFLKCAAADSREWPQFHSYVRNEDRVWVEYLQGGDPIRRYSRNNRNPEREDRKSFIEDIRSALAAQTARDKATR